MQEEVENRTLTLVVSGTKFTGRLLKAAISKYMAHCKEKKLQKQRSRDAPVTPHGKQTVKQIIGQNQGKRQLICFTGGALIGVPLFFLLRKPTGNSVAAMCMMLVMLPFFMLAMYEKHGQPLEKIVGNILKVAVIRPKQRPYQTNNFYAVLKRQEMLDKEVYDIVHRNKKMAASDVRENRGKNCAAGKDKEKTVPRR